LPQLQLDDRVGSRAGRHGRDSAGRGESAKPAPLSDKRPTVQKVTNKLSRVGRPSKGRPRSRAWRGPPGRGARGGLPRLHFLEVVLDARAGAERAVGLLLLVLALDGGKVQADLAER